MVVMNPHCTPTPNASSSILAMGATVDLELGQGWSVLVRGDAHRALQPDELGHLREDFDLRPWPSGEHDLFIRIVPAQFTGRRIRSQ
jgi:hypothetical protein